MKIHLGNLLHTKVKELKLSKKEMMMALRCSNDKLTRIYHSHHLDTETLLKCCFLLNYDFFELLSNNYKQLNKDNRESI
jgi:hypothetical protein